MAYLNFDAILEFLGQFSSIRCIYNFSKRFWHKTGYLGLGGAVPPSKRDKKTLLDGIVIVSKFS